MSVPSVPNPELVEVLKVWYSIFCTVTVMDAPEYSPQAKLEKLRQLRRELRERLPAVEEQMKQVKV